jgi:type II pantothenate kinase
VSGGGSRLRVGLDFGLTTTDAVAWPGPAGAPLGEPLGHATLQRPGPADTAVLARALRELGVEAGDVGRLAVTGGRSRTLPDAWSGVPLNKVPEPEAIGRGGLALAGVRRALVVSCGTGTAMVMADRDLGTYRHVSGTAVGGGTLVGLGQALLGERDAQVLADLAAAGDASGVDTTLGEVLGGGVGELPPEATAVNLGRLADLAEPPAAADLAAGLVAMVAQVIALLAINAARAHDLADVVATGRLAQLAPVRAVFDAVAELYRRPRFVVPVDGARATAMGAVLAVDQRG